MTDALKRAHEAIEELCLCDSILDRCPHTEPAHAALDAACEEAKASALQESGYWDSQGKIQKALSAERAKGEADHEWRRQMEAYGFDNVAKALDRIAAERERGRMEAFGIITRTIDSYVLKSPAPGEKEKA